MSSGLSPSHGSAGERIDRICDGFERAFRQHEHPQIREYLKQIEEPLQGRLFVELVALEVDLLREGGLKVELDKYLTDFPEYSRELNDIGQFGIVLEWGSDGQLPTSETKVWSPAELESLDQFRLIKILGQGTFGTVWLARDTRLERDVALKMARQDRLDSSDVDLFLREARAAANLAHPNIVAVHEIRNGQGVRAPYIVTALIDGPNLKNSPLMKGITPRKAAELTAKIARALHYAHRQGIVHRDLKPGNILLDAEDEPHLADFGLAKRESGDDTLSASGKLLGTPLYMAPEQAAGHHDEVDSRTDIYALGVILYELLTGQPPFRGALESLLYQISHSSPLPPRECRAGVPVDLERICLKCLSKQRTARYLTAQDLADDLDRYLNGESLRGINIPFPQRMQKWLWRNRRSVIISASTFITCLAVAAVAWWMTLPVDLRIPVRIQTNPPGCSITAVRLDETTGEPDPLQIEHATGQTPLIMRLRPAEYLIVAVLDDRRFHEVLRSVPTPEDGHPHFDAHTFWSRDKHDVISWREIKIPRSDLTLSMGFIEQNAQWEVPELGRDVVGSSKLRMPGFYFDITDHELSDEAARLRFFGSLNEEIEKAGKRIPSAAELFYLQDTSQQKEDLALARQISLPSNSEMKGLFSLPWEWTTTKSLIPSALDNQVTRLQAGGPLSRKSPSRAPNSISVRAGPSSNLDTTTGVRGVRSLRPRIHPEDFPKALDQ